jgi:hypothetical protein
VSSPCSYTQEEKAAYNRRYNANMPPEVRDRKNTAMRKRSASQRRFLASVKLTAGCIDCGYAGSAYALDFDHVRGSKEFALSWSNRTWLRIAAELEKCDVRCANCHRIRTHNK